MLLAGDIGGTKTLLGLYKPGSGARQPFAQAEFHSANYSGLEEVAHEFLGQTNQTVEYACFDVAGDISNVAHLRNSFDLAFSRMVFEHVEDGQRAWSNLYQLLAPGGVALAFVPTLYSVPFVINWLLPDKLAAAIVRRLYPNRTDEEDPVFPARYSWTFASDRRMRPMLSAIGYREVAILPFYGHGYYGSFPVIRDVHKWFTAIARRHDWRHLASFAYIAVRK